MLLYLPAGCIFQDLTVAMFHLAYNLYYHCKHAGEQELNFAIVGLPNGGKTTIKKVMNGDNTPVVVPTIGATKPIELKVRFNI